MKRRIRVALILISVTVLLTGIGLWRYHYLKILNAEPERVYKITPLQPNKSPTDTNPSKASPIKSDENTNVDDNTDLIDIEPSITTQRINDRIKPEETDNTDESSVDTLFGDIIEENLTPEVIAAIKKYEEAQSASADVRHKRDLLSDVEPLDWDAIGLLTDQLSQLQQQRKDALEILAPYSDQAFKELQRIYAREKVAAQIASELDDPNSDIESDDLRKRYEHLLEQASEELEQASEELSNSDK